MEQHFLSSVLHLDWHRIQESVKENILANEVKIVAYLKESNNDQHFNERIGFSDSQFP